MQQQQPRHHHERSVSEEAGGEERRKLWWKRSTMSLGVCLVLLVVVLCARVSSPTEEDPHSFGSSSITNSLLLGRLRRTSSVDAAVVPSVQPPPQGRRQLLLDVANLQQAYQVARAEYRTTVLEPLYGTEYLDILFKDPDNNGQSLARTVFQSTTIQSNAAQAWERLVRKVAIKVLMTHDNPGRSVQQEEQPVKFVWATGGHSAAAGHGNLFDQAYTQVLDKAAAPIFKAVGITFQARSYAMGGTDSAIEIAGCSAAIFGTDVDVLSWDYGMTDGRSYVKAELYARRALAVNPAVAFVMLQSGNLGGRTAVVQHMTEQGQAAFVADDKLMQAAEMRFPDCAALSAVDSQALPAGIRHYRCGNAMEKGEPLCGTEKWTLTGNKTCDERKFKTSWHPGWKWHAYRGHVYALFLMDVLEDALILLASPEAQGDLEVFRQGLQAAEDKDNEAMRNSHNFLNNGRPEEGIVQDDVSLDFVMTAPNYCHTARLAAEIRYQGILTDKSYLTRAGQYDGGMELKPALAGPVPDDRAMPLVYDGSHRQACNIPLQTDYKDFFFASGKYTDYVSLTIPTDAEIAAYGNVGGRPTNEPPPSLKGIIMLCAAACGWHCPGDTVDLVEGIESGQVLVKVNGAAVHNVTQVLSCAYLQKAPNDHIWPANNQGRFEVAAKVEVPNKYIRLSSILVW